MRRLRLLLGPRLGRSLLVAAATLATLGALPAAEPTPAEKSEQVSYHRDVRPIFQQHCQGCHQPARSQGGYVMTSYAELLRPGESGKAAVVPGQPGKSELLAQVRPDSSGVAMMPKGKDPLSKQQIETLTRWISQGARDDTPPAERVVVDAEHPPVYEAAPVITSLDYSPEGRLLAVSGHHEVLLIDPEKGQTVARLVGLSERVQALAFSPDGKQLAVAGGCPCRFGEVQVWDVATRKLRLSVTTTHDTLYGISWSHDGTRLAFGCADNTLRAIDAKTGEQVLFQGAHNDWVLDTVFSRDSSFLVSVSRDMSMKLTRVDTQRFIDNVTSITPGALKGGLITLARNPAAGDRKVKNTEAGTDMSEKWYDEVLTGGADGVPRLYKMHREKKRVIGDDANRIREYEAMPGRIYSVAFSADGSRFVAGSSFKGTGEVRVYQTADGKVISRTQGQIGPVFAVAFRPDGKQSAVAGFDGKVRLIDPATGKVIKDFIPVPLARTTARAASPDAR